LILIEPQIDLLLMSVQFEAGEFPCCCFKPKSEDEKEENEVNKMKLNRLDKQKKLETEKLLK